MMTYQNILLNIHEHVLTITINRPDKLNALNRKTIQEIGDAVQRAEKDAAIDGIIITGSGPKSFVAGADISEFLNCTKAEGKEMSAEGHKVFRSIETCNKPVVAAVNGFALGGGCELAMSCHIRIASANAKFGQPEVNLGLIPGYGGTQRLVQLIGKGKALELLMTADMINAEEAHRLGLVNMVTTPEELLSEADKFIKKVKRVSPVAIRGIVRSVNAYFDKDIDGLAFEVDAFGECFGTEDFTEGVNAFLEKRKPEFVRT